MKKSRTSPWRAAFLGVLFVSSAFVVAYAPSWMQLASNWADPESRNSHGWLVVAAILGLLFLNLPRRLSFSPPGPRAFAVVGGLVASAIWLAADSLAVESVAQFAAFLVLALSMHVAFGREISRQTDRCLLPLAFALPIWDSTNSLFQQMTIVVVGNSVRLLGVPAQLDGSLVTLPSGVFDIEPGCSGLQLFLAAATTGALLAAMRRESWLVTAKLVTIAGLIGLLANWMRVIAVVIAGHLTDMQGYLVRSEHYTLGWSLFAVGICAFIYWATRRPERDARVADCVSEPRAGAPSVGVWVSGLVLLVAPAVREVARVPEARAQTAEDARFVSSAWIGPVMSLADSDPASKQPVRRILADYIARDGGERVVVQIGRYASPEHAPDAMLSKAGFLPATEWQSYGASPIQLAAVRAVFQAQETQARDPNGLRWMIVYWYQVGARTYSSALRARVDFAIDRLRGAEQPFVVAMFASQCANECAAEARATRALAQAAGPELTKQVLE